MYIIQELNEKSLVELKEIALKLGIKKVNISKEELIYSIIDQQAVNPDIIKETKNDDNKNVATERPKKGKKVATSRPDKKENAELIEANKATNKIEATDTQDNAATNETKPKREKRPRIGKRTDVIKTTINNNDEQDKVQHVSYDKTETTETQEHNSEIISEKITNEETVSIF